MSVALLWAACSPEKSLEHGPKPTRWLRFLVLSHHVDVHGSITVVYHEWVELYRLLAVWTCGEEALLVPGFGG